MTLRGLGEKESPAGKTSGAFFNSLRAYLPILSISLSKVSLNFS